MIYYIHQVKENTTNQKGQFTLCLTFAMKRPSFIACLLPKLFTALIAEVSFLLLIGIKPNTVTPRLVPVALIVHGLSKGDNYEIRHLSRL